MIEVENAEELMDYIDRLHRLLESVHDQILGNDYQSAVELRYLESKIREKIRDAEEQLKIVLQLDSGKIVV